MNGQCLPILMYHSITERPRAATHRLSVAPETFEAQLDLLRRLGCTALSFSAASELLESGQELPERTVVLTFDDGYADFHEHALPVLERHGFTGTLFVTTGWLSDAGEHAAGRPRAPMLSWKQVREVADAGIEIGGHSHSHAQLDQVSDDALRAEVRDCRELLQEAIGQQVETFAYPYGYSSSRVRAAVGASGYRCAAAVTNSLARPHADRLAVPRLTIRRATSMATFERLVRAQDTGRAFLVDRALTCGWTVVRRGRHMTRRAWGDG